MRIEIRIEMKLLK